MSRWEYGGKYKLYDMSGLIEIGGGKLMVHDIYEPLPEFMKEADCIFVDPPGSLGILNSFYTKADRTDYKDSYMSFVTRLFDNIQEINPKFVYIEVFKPNKQEILDECEKRFKYVFIDESTYYHNKKNKCWIIRCSNEKDIKHPETIIDEEDYIKWICENVEFECIGDLCMGYQGLVGYYSYLNNKKFVGTEINKKRLANLVDKIVKKEKEKNK